MCVCPVSSSHAIFFTLNNLFISYKYMSYTFHSKHKPASKLYFLNDDNKICSADIEIEGGLLFNGLLQSKNAIGSMPPNVKSLLDKYGDAKI
jgi:hypothetical protein